MWAWSILQYLSINGDTRRVRSHGVEWHVSPWMVLSCWLLIPHISSITCIANSCTLLVTHLPKNKQTNARNANHLAPKSPLSLLSRITSRVTLRGYRCSNRKRSVIIDRNHVFDYFKVKRLRYGSSYWEYNTYVPRISGWGFVALTKNHPSKISWMKWLQ